MTTKIAIPTGADELAEIMADDQRRAEIFATPDTATEFITNWIKASNTGKELDDKITSGVFDALKSWGAVEGRPDMSALTKALRPSGQGSAYNALYNPDAIGASGTGAFKNFGQFVNTIWHKNGNPDPDLMAKAVELRNAYSSQDPAAGGFLIPEDFRSELLQLALEQAIVRPRATVITMGSKTTSVPYVDVTTHAGSVFGGMVFYWTAEAGDVLTSEARFGRVELEAKKLTGGAHIPNELFADAVALNSWLQRALPQGLAFFEDLAFTSGAGGMEPLGWMNGSALITVAKETAQAADSIVAENIFKMYSRMLPQSLGSAVWLASPDTIPQLFALSIAVGTGGAPIGIVNINSTPVPTILGRPLIITEKVNKLGDAGDIAFVDLSYYLLGDRQAVSVESSPHYRFMNDETSLKVIERVDGRPWIQSPLTPANGGATLSPFVTLAERA